MSVSRNIHLFCRVVDNFGDIGVCWRLARQLAHEHAMQVTLWVDHLPSFHRICADIDPLCAEQQVGGVLVRQWTDHFEADESLREAEVVIEAFACDLPAACLQAMTLRAQPPLWINLEYLSAEPWVEGCHALSARHPSLPLTRHFFFPGFTNRTGGLLEEQGLDERRRALQTDAAQSAEFLAGLGVATALPAFRISLFCYPTAPVASLLTALQTSGQTVQCLVPEGVAADAVRAFLQTEPVAGAQAHRQGLSVHVLPFMDQPKYDQLLWTCDLNFVRGEDSFIRAQWAARPFVWQIYPQDEDAHWQKLRAFLDRYLLGLGPVISGKINDLWQAWNGNGDIVAALPSFQAGMPALRDHALKWQRTLTQNGDLASNLIHFIEKNG